MTIQEFMIFTAALKTYYARENLLPNKQAVELWFEQLEDIPLHLAEMVLKQWVAINKWSPTIADIREQAAEILHGKIKTADEAWAKVQDAIYKDFKETDGKFIKIYPEKELDTITKKALDEMGGFEELKHIIIHLLPNEKKQQQEMLFKKIYNRIAEAEKKARQTPKAIQCEINRIYHLRLQQEAKDDERQHETNY